MGINLFSQRIYELGKSLVRGLRKKGEDLFEDNLISGSSSESFEEAEKGIL